MRDMLTSILSSGLLLGSWFTIVVVSTVLLLYDLGRNNSQIMPIMKLVWFMTVLYSGPLGLWIYAFSGRRQISRDSLWRKGFRSVSHCYSGCGAGELVGVFIAAGLLSLGNVWVASITFFFAYVFGFAMTMGPLMQSGMAFTEALRDALISDSVTIAVMEISAISVDLYLAPNTSISDVLFWSSLVVSLTLGLIVAYPVNVALVRMGIKGGMGNPRNA